MYYLRGFVPYGEGWHGGNPDYKFYQLYFGESGIMSHSAKDVELMQVTGLYDKNGKEIYEGDVFGSPEILRCVVEKEPDGAYILRFIHPKMKGKKISILDEKVSKSPIIGNIYENPELIK